MSRLTTLFIIVLIIVFPGFANAQGINIYGEGVERIQLLKDVASTERTLGFAVPGASGTITSLPELQVVSVALTATNGWAFDFRYSPASSVQEPFDLSQLSDEARETYLSIARGTGTLAELLASNRDFAPFTELFQAIADARGIITARRDRTFLSIAQYKETERRDAATITDIEIAGRQLHLRQSPLTPNEFDAVFNLPSGIMSEMKVLDLPTGILAYTSSPGLPPDQTSASLAEELAGFMEELLPIAIIASDNNYKTKAIHDELAAYAMKVRHISEFREFSGSNYGHSCYEPEPEYSAYDEPAPGYTVYIEDEAVRRLVYYYRTDKVNGFVLQDTFTNYSHIAVTGTREIFDPTPYKSQRIPMPDYTWEETYPHIVNQPFICPGCAKRDGGIDLSSRDLFFFKDSANLFSEALDNDDFHNAVSGDLILGLRKYAAMSGEFSSEESSTPLVSLRYREIEGLSNVGVLTYRDDSYQYQLTLPPRRGYMNFAFSSEKALAPQIWRFYLAPAGEKVQLVMSYPVDVPLGQAERRFQRSASALAGLYRLSKYMSRYEPVLEDVTPIINEIWTERDNIGARMFIRPGTLGMYTDWLTAGYFGEE
jgi:hypothetical protein